MGKRAMTPARLAEYIVRFNKERYSLKVYMKLDEKYTHICDKQSDIVLLSAKHEYIDELITALWFLYFAGYWCTNGCAHVIQSDYYKSKHRCQTPHNAHLKWTRNFEKLNPL